MKLRSTSWNWETKQKVLVTTRKCWEFPRNPKKAPGNSDPEDSVFFIKEESLRLGKELKFPTIAIEICLNISVKKDLQKYGVRAKELIMNEMWQMDRYFGKFVIDPVNMRKMAPEDRKFIIPSFMLLKEKLCHNGKFEKLKIRILVGVNHQDRQMYQ